ncbi:hypothetical protein ACFQJ7_08430 [Halovenus rubra]|uniref:PIN domain-containing protein n=2 Tax=Halovenus rubra TaxID=869890 RepID=A0ABD5X4J6_9EURY|nr:hypothetical protein [Halovenus rubra]
MIVVDTSALITIASINLLDHVLSEYDLHTTATVIEELEKTAEYDDVHGQAAQDVLDQLERIGVHNTNESSFQSSRIDEGEGTAASLANETQADFLITDDLRALPELQTVTHSNVVISPVLLKALVKRDLFDQEEALEKLDEAAENRDWLESPIYRKAKNLFE